MTQTPYVSVLMFTLTLMLALSTLPVEAEPYELVKVNHQRELRGAWVASVDNINFPSRPGLGAAEQKKELCAIVDTLAANRFNAVFFQVRPEGDALYRSDLEPWSRYLMGAQGQDPGYNPLAYLIKQAHQKNIEVHAWLNPYRASAQVAEKTTFVAPHLGVVHPQGVLDYGSFVWMDPTSELVQRRLVDVSRDLTRRYDIDGLHFDDYFYPYPEDDLEFPDQDSRRAYQARGGNLSVGDWRRESVNKTIENVSQAVRHEKSYVRFGVSPFGLPSPARPEGIEGFDQYEKLYADPQLWMDRGWVDYLAPQLYWPSTQTPQAFAPLLSWWSERSRPGYYLFPGLNLSALGSKPTWTPQEYREQFEMMRADRTEAVLGSICWSVKPLLENRQGIADEVFSKVYPKSCLTPPMADQRECQVQPPRVRRVGRTVLLHHQDPTPLRAWTVYREGPSGWELSDIFPGTVDRIELQWGRWAIAAAAKNSLESRAQVVTIP